MGMYQKQALECPLNLSEQQLRHNSLILKINSLLREEITKRFARKSLKELHEFVEKLKT